jgi:hypothetical protein
MCAACASAPRVMCTACDVHCMRTACDVHCMCNACACAPACAPRVQGPCAENQLVLARSCVCENVMPLLEFLLALQLSGGQGDRGRPTPLDVPGLGRRRVRWSALVARPGARSGARSRARSRALSPARSLGWAAHDPLSMAQLLEAALSRAEDAAGRDAVTKFARTLEPQPWPQAPSPKPQAPSPKPKPRAQPQPQAQP